MPTSRYCDHNPSAISTSLTFIASSDRLLLRPLAPGDWDAFRAYSLSDRASLSLPAETEGDAWRHFVHLLGHLAMRGYAPLAFVLRAAPEKAVGVAGPYFASDWPEPELGWQIWDASLEGKGYASEAVLTARAWCAETYGWQRMVSYIKPGNLRSEKLAERLGCVLDDDAARRPDGSPVWRHPV